MDPVTMSVIAGSVVAPMIAGYFGNKAHEASNEQNAAALDKINKKLQDMGLPNISPVEYEEINNVYVVHQQDDSLLNGIEVDPQYKEAQLAALGQLGDLSEGGLSLGDKVAMQELTDMVGAQDAGRQGAIQQNMAARGMAGGGQELAARMMSQQGGADRAGRAASQQAARAEQRALEAIMQRGVLGGNMRGQEFDQQAKIAQAQDAINQFNTLGKRRGSEVAQDLEGRNTTIRNLSKDQKNLIESDLYQAQLDKLRIERGITGQQNQVRSDSAGNKSDLYSGAAQSAATAGQAYANYKPKAETLVGDKYGWNTDDDDPLGIN